MRRHWPPSLAAALCFVMFGLFSKPSSGQMSQFVWNEIERGTRADAPPQLITLVDEEVQKIIDAGGLFKPLHVLTGIQLHEPQNGGILWWRPRDTIFALSYIYRYLSPAHQAEIKAHLDDWLSRFPPWSLTVVRLSTDNLVDRQYYPVPADTDPWVAWDVDPYPGHPDAPTLYALWLFASETGDWAYIQNHWAEIVALYDQIDDIAPASYGDIAGFIGFARMAEEMGDASLATAAEAIAVQGMNDGLDFVGWNELAHQTWRNSHEIRAPVFRDLTPEVGAYLRSFVLSEVSLELDQLTRIRPRYPADASNARGGNMVFWWGTHVERAGNWNNTEVSVYRPELGIAIFTAYAYVMDELAPSLQGYLDIPWCIGDLYFLQKLAAVLDAYSHAGSNTPPSVQITAPGPSTAIDVGEEIVFAADAMDVEDGDLTADIEWISDWDGLIGTGGMVTVSTLSENVHQITASVTDSGGLAGMDQITVIVGDAVNGEPSPPKNGGCGCN